MHRPGSKPVDNLLSVVKLVLALGIGIGIIILLANFYELGQSGAEAPIVTGLSATTGAVIALTCTVIRVLISRFTLTYIGTSLRRDRTVPWSIKPQVPPPTFIDAAAEAYVANFPDVDTVKFLIRQIFDPVDSYDRITEHAELHPATQERTIHLSLRRSDNAPILLVPVLAPAKGQLVDELDISFDGEAATTLPFLENQGALIAVARTFIDEALGPDALRTPTSLVNDILMTVASPAPANPDKVFRGLEELSAAGSIANANALALLRDLLEFCADNFFILGVLPKGQNQRVRVTVTTRVSSGFGKGGYLDAVRVAFGLRPRGYDFQLRRSSGAASYHFSVRTPRGTYVSDRYVDWTAFPSAEERLLQHSRVSRGVADQRINHSTKYVHLYIRDAVPPNGAIPTLHISLLERPPGLLEVVSGLSVLLTVSVWFVGRFHNVVFAPPPAAGVVTPISGAWTTILFGIPTLLAGWVITRIDGPTLARMSFRSVAMTIWLAGNSFAAVLAAGFKVSGAQLTESSMHWRGLVVSHPIWASVMVSCGIHLVMTTVFVISRALRYILALSGLTYTYGRSEV